MSTIDRAVTPYVLTSAAINAALSAGGGLDITAPVIATPTIAVWSGGAGPVHEFSTTISEGEAGGVGEPRNIINRIRTEGAVAYSKSYGQYNGLEHAGSATLTTGNTLHNYFKIEGSGNVTNSKLVFSHYWFDDAADVVNSSTVFEAGSTTYDGSSGGFQNNISGFYVGVLGHITRTQGLAIGFHVVDQDAAGGVQGFRSEIASGAGKWAFFDSGGAGIFTNGNFQAAGNLTFTGTSASYTANWTDSRAMGAAAAGSAIAWQRTLTFSGDSGGTSDVRAVNETITTSGSNALAGVLGRRTTLTLGATAGATTSATGIQSIVSSTNAGTVTTGAGFNASYQVSGSGNVTSFRHYDISNATYSSTGVTATVSGYQCSDIGHATLVTNAYAFRALDITASATSAQGFRSEVTAGSGKAAFVDAGGAGSIFTSLTATSATIAGVTIGREGFLNSVITTVDFNSGNTDNSIAIPLPTGYTRYILLRVVISNASASLTTATCGVFTATGGGGTAVVASGTVITVSTASEGTNNNTQTLSVVNAGTNSWTVTPLYFRVQTPQGSAATGKVTVVYEPVS